MTIRSILFLVTALLITTIVEVPINNQITAWTVSTTPAHEAEIRIRWQLLGVIRTICALASFALLAAAMNKPYENSRPV